MSKALAIDIGGTSVKYAWVDEQGCLTNQGSFYTAGLENIEDFLGELYPIIVHSNENGIINIGISSLGVFDSLGNCLGGVENLEFLQGTNLTQLILTMNDTMESVGSIHIINDGAAAAMGEYWRGEGRGSNLFLCMTLGTGIGSAVVINGTPLLGAHYHSGEIGYTNYLSAENYMEQDYSTQGVLRRGGFPDGYAFVQAIQEKDTEACQLFDEWTEVLGQLVANIVLLLDPEKVIIGGGISAQKELLIPALERTVKEHLPGSFRGELQICVAKTGNQAGLLGAVWKYFT